MPIVSLKIKNESNEIHLDIYFFLNSLLIVLCSRYVSSYSASKS